MEVPARPVHPAARKSEQTRITMIKHRELFILYDHPGWYTNMSIRHQHFCPRDLQGESHYFYSCSEPLMQ